MLELVIRVQGEFEILALRYGAAATCEVNCLFMVWKRGELLRRYVMLLCVSDIRPSMSVRPSYQICKSHALHVVRDHLKS